MELYIMEKFERFEAEPTKYPESHINISDSVTKMFSKEERILCGKKTEANDTSLGDENNDMVESSNTKKDKNDIFDKDTGSFSKGVFGELPYDKAEVNSSIYITNGMMNLDASKATQNFSSIIRSSLQNNAIASKLSEDTEYFTQFGCFKRTPAAIRIWFSQSEDYTLHETKDHTVQIVDAKIHSSVHHDGGVSQEKDDMISGDSKDN